MDRAEATGFGVAVAGHAALLGALSLGFANAVQPPLTNPPIEVSFVDEVGLDSAAPVISAEEPAAKLGEIEGPPEPAAPPPTPVVEPAPAPTPQSRAQSPGTSAKPVQKPRPAPPATAKVQPAPKQTNRSTGRLTGLLSGISDKQTDSRSTAPQATAVSAAARSSLAAEIKRQLKPHWKPPTGADSSKLRTELRIRLARNGSVSAVEVIRTTGQTASNRPQVKLHQEQAVKAVRLAAPFKLPAEFYEAWKDIATNFDERLSQ